MKTAAYSETVLNLKGKLISKSNLLATVKSFLSVVEADLSDNKLEALPGDLVKFKSIRILNVANNPFKDYSEIAQTLQSLPNLSELHIDLEKQADAQLLLSALPQLKMLNGKSTQEDCGSDIDIDIDIDEDKLSLESEVKRVNAILQRASALEGFASFKADLQCKLREQADFLNSNAHLTNYLYAVNALKAKMDVCCFIQSKLASMIPLMNKKADATEVSNLLLEEIDQVEQQNEMVDVMFKLHPKIQQQVKCLKSNSEGIPIKPKKKDIKPINHLNGSNENQFKPPPQSLMKSSLSNRNLLKESKAKDEGIKTERQKLNKSSSTQRTVRCSSSIDSHQLSLKQLITIINEIYQSKGMHDQKCIDNRLSKETLEQHMYTFLNKKYGLKSITIGMACSIINGIRQFSQTNSEVCLFGKILRNELEEESHQVFLKLKLTLIELLNYYYQVKNPYKSQGAIEKAIADKQQSFLSMDEWLNMLKYLFPSDHEVVKEKIMDYISKQNESNQKYISINYLNVDFDIKQLSREEIKKLNALKLGNSLLYSDFAMILLDFQIRLRDKYLLNFVKLFRGVDTDNDGVIDENEFKELIVKCDIYPIEDIDAGYERLITLVDPFNTKRIVFSDCVSVFSNEKYDEEMSLMDKIALNNNDG